MDEGSEKRVLYHSSFRAICTYGCSLPDLDQELKALLQARGAFIKEDHRRNLCGKRKNSSLQLLPAAIIFILKPSLPLSPRS